MVTVQDKKGINTREASKLLTDSITQQWGVAVWGTPADRCFNTSFSTGCEVLTVKIDRKWSSYDRSEDLDFSDGQFKVKLVTENQFGIVNEYNELEMKMIESPSMPSAAFRFQSSLLAPLILIYLFF